MGRGVTPPTPPKRPEFWVKFFQRLTVGQDFANMVDCADVAELVDALDLGSSSVRSEGSSPFIRS